LNLVSDSHKDEVAVFYRKFFLEKKDNVSYVFPLTNISDGVVWLDQKLSAVWDESKFKIVGYSAVTLDVTGELELFGELKDSEERLANIKKKHKYSDSYF
jgi:hypothetical protein